FAGVERILHAGDIGSPAIILELEAIAPVTAVVGNTDEPGLRFRQTEALSLGGVAFLVHHIVNPHQPEDPLKDRIARERPAAVVFGHTHKPFSQRLGGILYFNPGYAGKTRFGLERSVAILRCGREGISWEYLKL